MEAANVDRESRKQCVVLRKKHGEGGGHHGYSHNMAPNITTNQPKADGSGCLFLT